MLKAYLKQIADTSKRGDAREESYYPVLKDLIDEYCSSTGKKKSLSHLNPRRPKLETRISGYGTGSSI